MIAEWLRAGRIPWFLLNEVPSSRQFVTETVSGVIRWRRWLEHILSRIAARPPPQSVLPYLLLGLYQIMVMDDVPVYAAVNETVKSARESRIPAPLARFLNAALRTAGAEAQSFKAERFSLPAPIRESHQDIMFRRWAERYGRSAALSLCVWNNSRPRVVLRPRIPLDEYSLMLKNNGVRFRPHRFDPARFLVIESPRPVRELPGYAEGMFYVQDPATAVPVDMLDPRPGHDILDACAAPGGKTAIMADMVAPAGAVTACDSSPARLRRLAVNLQRLRISNVSVAQLDAADPAEISRFCRSRLFDRILLDAPCTGTGVIRRRPDIKWRFTTERLEKAARVQAMLLASLSAALKPGGRLVYSTCSMEPEENEQLVRNFLAGHPWMKMVSEKRIFPPATETDGAYAAVLEKAERS